MSGENNFQKPPQKKPVREEPFTRPVEGDGFTVKEKVVFDGFERKVGPSLEFRTGETSETARAREEKEAKKTALEKRNYMAKWFRDGILEKGWCSETLQIKNDGSLDPKKRAVGEPSFIISAGGLKSPEDLYELMRKISEEHPELDISIEVDPFGKWIKYRVVNKVESGK